MTETLDTDLAAEQLPFRIRRAVFHDARRVVEYLKEIFKDPNASISDVDEMFLDEQREREHLKRIDMNPNGIALIAEIDDGSQASGEVIGYLTLEPMRRKKIEHIVELGMSVRKDWRGKGVGQGLIAFAEKWAMSVGSIEKISLNVFSDNVSARKLYEKAGFVVEGILQKQIKIEGQYQDLILMGKVLRTNDN